jgi:two-component system chemotaxis response regulator CheY
VGSANRLALLVEDDPDIRKFLRRCLEKLDLRVSEAATGRAALALLQEEKPDLVCLDLMLPEFSGYEICEKIRASPELHDVPVLVVSARAMPPDRAMAEEAGATGYLIKPIRWKTFSAAVTEMLDGHPRAVAE